MGIFWRQGVITEGGPGDIMVRFGYKTTEEPSAGLRIQDFRPAVDPGAAVSDYVDAITLNNAPAFNISSNTIPWTKVGEPNGTPTNTLEDTTTKNPYEDARAHRAVLRGDDFYIGYSYAKDWAVATYTDMDNYNFWMRHYSAPDESWTMAANISNFEDVHTHAKEPRLVGMPGNGPGCTDPANITNHENCQAKGTLLVAWGEETNVYSHIGGSVEGDIYYTRTTDKGISYEPIEVVADGIDHNRYESQLRSTPAGNYVFTVWNDYHVATDETQSGLSVSPNGEEIIADIPASTVTYTVTNNPEIPVGAPAPVGTDGQGINGNGDGTGSQNKGNGGNQGTDGQGINGNGEGDGSGNQGIGGNKGIGGKKGNR